MGFFKPTAFFKGAAKEGLTMFDKAESISEEGLANLKIATAEVNEEIAEVKDKHNNAMQIGDNVGGGAFAQFLVKQRGLDYMSGLYGLSEADLNTELSSLKSKFNALDDSQKAELTEGGFSEAVTSSYDKEVDALKVKKGLVNNNNMGEATANTLTGKVQQMVDRQAQPRRDDIISTVGGGKLRESEPIEGGFDTISSGQQGPIDYLTAGVYGENIQKIKMEAESGFEKFLTSNRFKEQGTNMFFDDGALEFIGNIIFTDGIKTDGKTVQDVRDRLDFLSSETDVSPALVAESILKDYYLEQTYQGFFDYTSFNDMYELNEASKAYEASRNQVEKS